MEICKNKASGKNFIYLETVPGGKVRLITPDSEIKLLNPALFEKPEEEDKNYLLTHGLITVEQHKTYENFFLKDILVFWTEAEKLGTNSIDQILSWYARLTPAQKRDFSDRMRQIKLDEK